MSTSVERPVTAITEPIPLVPNLAGCPYAAYAQLRDGGGVHRAVMAEGLPVCVVSRHSDVKALLADPRMSMNARTVGGGYPGFRFPPALNEHLLNVDADDHARIRRLIAKAFTPRRIEALSQRIQQVTDLLLGAMAAKGTEADVLSDLAVPLPIEVISDVLGISARDGAAFRRFTSTLMDPSAQARAERPRVVAEMSEFFTTLVAQKRTQPGDDLFSVMIAASETGEKLSEIEMTSLAFLILWAGFETTVYAIATGISLALNDPEAAALVRGQESPDTEAMSALVEEVLRIEGPLLTAIRRFPTEDIEVAGRTIPAGSTVLLAIASANRDPDAFADPDSFVLTRSGGEPHLAFGRGPHYCIGASLARTEIRTAIWSLLRRFPDIRSAGTHAQASWKPDYRQHALTTLPVILATLPSQ